MRSNAKYSLYIGSGIGPIVHMCIVPGTPMYVLSMITVYAVVMDAVHVADTY